MPRDMLTWTNGPRDLICRVCGVRDVADLVVEITALSRVGLEAVRCRACGSIDLLDDPEDFSPDDHSLDVYIESGAGVGTIASTLSTAIPGSVHRFLDVGCNYPFSLDLARFLYGWEVLGVEPSPAGGRGARELDVEIRNEFLTPDIQIGGAFDLALASEVIEHVTDPVQFLQTIRAHLGANGVLVLTTPAAEVVSPDEQPNTVLQALSPGYHVFLASVHGMTILLERAGFAHSSVEREGGTLHVSAGMSADVQLRQDRPGVSDDDLERYYAWRGKRSRAASAIGVGMTTRLVRLRSARGDFAGVRRALPAMYRAIRAVHRLDLRFPRRALVRVQALSSPPWSITGAAFALGMFHLLSTKRHRRAVEYFELATEAASLCLASATIVDGDTEDLLFQAPFHRLLALAHYDPVSAARDALLLSERFPGSAAHGDDRIATRRLRVYVELVSLGHYLPESELAEAVRAGAPGLARSANSEARTAALDALYSLGIASLNTGAAATAARWLELCREEIARGPATGHSTSLERAVTRHLDMARERVASATEADVHS